MDYLRHLSLEKIAPQYWLHEARHRAVGNIESSPRFAPFAAIGSRQTDAILESAAAALNDPDLLAMHFWLSWILIFEAYRNAPEYRADYLDRLREIPLRQRLQYLSSEFKQGRWPQQTPALPARLSLPPKDDWALVITRNYAGVKASVRDFSSDIVEAMSHRFDRVVVALIGPLQGIEARDNVIGITIPPGRADVDPSDLDRVRRAIVSHPDCAVVRGIVARRVVRWLARVRFARRAIDAGLPESPPRTILSMAIPDPECTLIMNKYRGTEGAIVMPMVEPVASSRVSFPCRRVFVTGSAQAAAQSAANPQVRFDVVGSNEAYANARASAAARNAPRDPRRTVLVLGKLPEASWHNTAIVAAVVERARQHGFVRVIYRGKPNKKGEFTTLSGEAGAASVRDAVATGLLEITDGTPFEQQMAGADAIVSATGNSFLLALLCGVPVMGYCFNERVDLGEAPYLAAIPETDRPVMCRDIGAIAECVERTLARARRPVGPLPPAIVAALFGDPAIAPAERIAELLAGTARSNTDVEVRPAAVGAR